MLRGFNLSVLKTHNAIGILSAEEPPRELVSAETQMLCHVAEDSSQRPDTQGVVRRDRHVMLAAVTGREAHVAASLTGDPISDLLQRPRARRPTGRAAASRGDHFVPREVQADHLGRLAVLEVAANGISNLRMDRVDRVGLDEDREAERASDVAALGRFLDQEDHFVHLRSHAENLPSFSGRDSSSSLAKTGSR